MLFWQSAQLTDKIMLSMFTYSHFPGLDLLSSWPVLSVCTFTSKWPLPFLKCQKWECGSTKYFMIDLKIMRLEFKLTTPGSPVRCLADKVMEPSIFWNGLDHIMEAIAYHLSDSLYTRWQQLHVANEGSDQTYGCTECSKPLLTRKVKTSDLIMGLSKTHANKFSLFLFILMKVSVF